MTTSPDNLQCQACLRSVCDLTSFKPCSVYNVSLASNRCVCWFSFALEEMSIIMNTCRTLVMHFLKVHHDAKQASAEVYPWRIPK